MKILSRQDLFKKLSAIIASRAIETIPKLVLLEVLSFFEADEGAIYTKSKEEGFTLLTHDHCRVQDTCCLRKESYYEKSVVESLSRTKQTALFERVKEAQEKGDLPTMANACKALAYTPLLIDEEVIGIIILSWCGEKRFKEYDEELLETIGNIVGIGLYNGKLIDSLKKREEQLQFVLQALIHAKEEEGKRISRELHDEVGQDLTSISLRLKMLQDETDLETIYDRLNGLRILVTETLSEVQRISMDLRPTALDDLGLIPSLRWYIEQFRVDNPIEIQFHSPRKLEALTPEVEMVIYRVILEGLMNISRHSKARTAEVVLAVERECLTVDIRDDGIGMDSSPSKAWGLGILGMQERIKAQDGQLHIQSEPDKGTHLRVFLPYPRGDKSSSAMKGRINDGG
ncbi:GAF domain-containing sensor histidine kinase [Desulfitobacterium chlororespirans]|uniref:Oxygen sensor histidine kinase NreB n=1 Tax=Desulfitobacterium chlororespirans DSM 11544 TaxID=1121395 RepID=A0A1M7UCU8_9FIRM|nr:GAF domain-containing sensor histidine kinase [Desulfitobacterium chlororespirans]SHN80766.1 Histidine kinase-, DNA gyrase B-, and HSP90-like ATPase [Desulfitobacterium chlororespirans DSM 11544]